MAGGRLRGGKQRRRDRWYGLRERRGFAEFERWWHREGKRLNGNRDIDERQKAEEAWDQWISLDRPLVKIGTGVVSLRKENDLRNAFLASDNDGLLAILAKFGPEDQSETLDNLIIDKILTTRDVGVRNALALALADIGSKRGAEAIRSLLRSNGNRKSRGTLLYALSKMEASIDLDAVIDTLLHGSLEAAEYCIDALDEHRVVFPDEASATEAARILRDQSGKTDNKGRQDILIDAAELIEAAYP